MSTTKMAFSLQSADLRPSIFTLLLFILVNPCMGQSTMRCLDVNLNPTVCIPGPENILKRRSIMVTPNGSTCGTPASGYCRPKPLTDCPICNASNPSLSHGPNKLIDSDFPSSYWGSSYQPTWWQSITWWDARSRGLLIDNTIKVNLTLSMNKSYDITGDIKITFYSSKPNAFIFERSTDFGITWTPFKYYADNCNLRFGASVPTTSTDKFQATCLETQNSAAVQGQQIIFNPMASFPLANFWQSNIQQYVKATDIRIRLEYPWTDGNHVIEQQNFLNQFYYDVTDIQIYGRCHCNGHAPFCQGSTQQQVCYCQHGTEGIDCERCKPLFNNKTWQAAASSDKPNPCEKCQCNDHAQSCVYNSTLKFGVCTDCNHNTTGFFCDKCRDKFYRNVSIPVNGLKACLPCDCFADGIVNNGSCSQVAMSNMSIGQCLCKDTFRGRKCDLCKDGYYGVRVVPIGQCKECNCSSLGTVNRSLTCDQITGQCLCKFSIQGKQCASCRDGYYSFPNSTDGQCASCVCNAGGAYSNNCNKTSGHCFCRNGIESTSCSVSKTGYFYPAFDFNRIEAESSTGSYETVSSVNGEGTEFTGQGYARLKFGSVVTFSFQPQFTAVYNMVIRYKQPLQPMNLSVTRQYSNNTIFVQHSSFNISLAASVASSRAFYYHPDATEYIAKRNYSISLSLTNMSSLNDTLDVDSIVMFWDYRTTQFFQSSNQTMRNETKICWQSKQGLTRDSQDSSSCKQIAFSINSQLFNGTMACDCNVIGSVNTTNCERYGGQCNCKPGVTGRTCNQCKPGYFNFTSDGCTACNCSTLGSKSLVCDVVSGKCPCKPGIVNRTCSQCQDSFYGFQTGLGCRNCSCNWDGSAFRYCDTNGLCTCKNTTTGPKCDRCKPFHFNFTSNGCMHCGCNSLGSTNLQCDLVQGNCTCKQNVQGNKCNSCGAGTFNLRQSNPYGCQSCFCYNKTEACSSSSGFNTSSIQSSFINVSDYWSVKMSNGLDANYANTSSGISITTPINLYAPRKYLGNRLSSYAQSLTIQLTFAQRPGTTTATTAQVGLQITSTYSTMVSFTRTVNVTNKQQSIIFSLHEFFAVYKMSSWALQHTLSSVKLLSIQFNSTNISSIVVSNIELSSASNSSASLKESGYVESCTCPANFTGLSCQNCAAGYTREIPGNGSYTGCKLCSCNSRSLSCNPQSGICSNCRIGSEGDYCQRCQPGVQAPDCTRCMQGFYGLNDTSFFGCRPCECVLLNTVGGNDSLCNEYSGQCTCRSNIGGRTCNRCAENAINTTASGCQSCSACYGLVQIEVQALRKDIVNITNALTSVQSISQLSMSPTFGQRLDSLNKSITALAANANKSANVESGLALELSALNVSLDKMQSTLQINVSHGVNQTNEYLRTLNTTMVQITALKNEIYGLSWGSSYVLQNDVTKQMNGTGNLKRDLNITSTNIATKLNQYQPIWNASNNLTSEIIRKSADTNDSTSKISTHLAQNALWVNTSTARIVQLRIAASGYEIKSKALQSNLSFILNNITELSRRSSLTLSEAVALNITTNATATGLQTRYQMMRNDFITLNNSILALGNDYLALNQVIKNSRNRSQVISRSLNETEKQTATLASQAANAENVANSAVISSNNLLKEVENMLKIVKNFNTTSNAAENMASLSLKNTQEVNKTSRQAIAYTNQIRVDLSLAVLLAKQSFTMARNASFLAGNLSTDLNILVTNARILEVDSSASLYKGNYFDEIKTNLSTASINRIQPRTNECANITIDANKALKNATLSMQAAVNGSTKVTAKQALIDQLIADFQKLNLLNSTSLQQLQNTVTQHRASFSTSNTRVLVAQLRTSYLLQQRKMQEYKLQISQLRTEVAVLKSTIGSLSTLEGCS